MLHVPTIDISPYIDRQGSVEQREAVARALDDAASTVGFMQIVGHGVPKSAIDGLTAAFDAFYALPIDVKKRYVRPENRGYSPPKSESLSMSLGVANANQMNDFFEAFTVGAGRSAYPERPDLPASSYPENVWPDDVAPAFRAGVEEWFAHARKVSRVLLHAFTDGLTLPTGYFDDLVDHSIDIMNLNNYALDEGEIALAGELTGMGAHTDFGILTVLWADQVPGLQVLDADGVWHDVQPADGALIVNLGDAMARWTNDRWLSTIHRVDPPIVDGRIMRRRSAAFFFDGNFDATIETLPGCADTDRPGYSTITVAEHIEAKLAGLKAGVAPTGVEREAERLAAARSAS